MNVKNIMGYCGLFFSFIYRIPQILKIYRLKKGNELSKKFFLLQNAAYISFIIYLFSNNNKIDYILLIYYSLGIFQNLLIISMKKYYAKSNPQIENKV